MEKEKKENKIIKGRRPQFIIFTDKDGTINLEDKQLGMILNLARTMEGIVIPVTGRTVGDIKSEFEAKKLPVPQIIVGDNGANIYSTENDEFFLRSPLNAESVHKLVSRFIELGGKPELIRYTNGKTIFTSDDKKVLAYYKKSTVSYACDNIVKAVLTEKDITKITLAGNLDIMKAINEYAKGLDFWTDMDTTKFPTIAENNYRLDVAGRNINKGKAVKMIANAIQPQYGYMCIGNGYNDLSMFRQAIMDGMTAAVMGDADPGLIAELELLEKYHTGKLVVVPAKQERANKLIYRSIKIVQQRLKEEQRAYLKEKRHPDDIKVKPQVLAPKRGRRREAYGELEL